MKRFLLVIGGLFFGAVFFGGHCQAADWRFPVGISYVSGFGDVVDLFEENKEAEGFTPDADLEWPVGITFQPYDQLENGLRIGFGLGPMELLLGDEGWFYSDPVGFYDVPLNVNVGYTFAPSADFSPYIRLGVAYHIAGGDYVESVSPGILAGIGFEFKRYSPVGFGIEFAYDTSEVEFESYEYTFNGSWWEYLESTKEIKPHNAMLSLFIMF